MEQVLDIKAAEMSSEERNLLQNSYKNLIQKQRETWRLVNILTDDDQYGKYKGFTQPSPLFYSYIVFPLQS